MARDCQLQGKTLAADATAVGKNLEAVLGGHTSAETELALAGKSVGLESAFLCHDGIPLLFIWMMMQKTVLLFCHELFNIARLCHFRKSSGLFYSHPRNTRKRIKT